MTNPCTVLLELLGMLIGIGGWFCSLAATIMPQWFSLSTELNGMESYEQGLWEACVIQEAGSECRPYDTILGLDPKFMLARVLMLRFGCHMSSRTSPRHPCHESDQLL